MSSGISVRRGMAAATAVVLVVEGLAIAFLNWLLGLIVQKQEMSMGGISHTSMAVGSWVAGGLFGLFLVVCAALALRIALRDRMAGRLGRIVLIVCAVVHGVVGAVVIGLVGWAAFVGMMVILGLLVGTLLIYAPEDAVPAAVPSGAVIPTVP
ncbi:hypothetical protein SAMN05216267_105332 [Actinacidiphila rubida]|uniref:Integral membrane protein n=1 Tax=Actinacidiphila rubida TaxID=310780 RepID=A0A1H8TIH6_9ACTN|nr:hypothetical protein [Actinacidiphila rubida]SEO90363.1 hypothetical protein SAMN05216267_105332 [Actinacidiphila rubida]